MSRSYRKPWFKDGYGSRGGKRFRKNYANRRLRGTNKIIGDFNTYRKFTDPWDICDYKYMYDPHVHISYWGGKKHIIEPDPLWKAVRK